MDVDIRPLAETDLDALAEAWPSRKDPDRPRARWERLLEMNREGLRVTLIAWLDGAPVGSVNLIWTSNYKPFAAASIPEIHSMGVVEPLRGRGIGTKLVRRCEELAARAGCSTIGIGVGVTEQYARARRLYPHLGYQFDGRGVWTNDWGSAEYLTKPLTDVAKVQPGGVE